MESHRAWMLGMLRKNTPEAYRKLSRRRKPNQYSVHFKLRWNLVTFMEQQQYSDEGIWGSLGESSP
ncbi:hypothetical protein PG997_012008 [Apiospora hydei]|uniref:Uncharacterized protein n=1 Tax=Apiospora hydei TaxID=1337664 RepID=A0ABR1V232_9PEZI